MHTLIGQPTSPYTADVSQDDGQEEGEVITSVLKCMLTPLLKGNSRNIYNGLYDHAADMDSNHAAR